MFPLQSAYLKETSASLLSLVSILHLATMTISLAATKAYWRFEEGMDGANVARNGLPDGVFYGAMIDSSGNGNALSTWSDGDYGGYHYRMDRIPSGYFTGENTNLYSIKNTGGWPCCWTSSSSLRNWTPQAWTIELAFQPELHESDDYMTLVGRDSFGAHSALPPLAALYLQIHPDRSLAIEFCDVSGYWHEAVSPPGLVPGFTWLSDPDGITGQWQAAAAVCNGSILSLYYRNMEAGDSGYRLVAQTNIAASGSPNRRLTAGLGSGSDWTAGNWSVGRGLYDGIHTDRAWGYIDEVRISDVALSPSQFLFTNTPSVPLVPQPISPGEVYPPGATLTNLNPIMAWSPAADVTGYGLYIRDVGSDTLVYNNDFLPPESSEVQIHAGVLQPGRAYRWNARAKNAQGWSDFSERFYFTTSTVVFNAPGPLETQSFSDRIELGWTDNTSDELGFRIERKIGTGSWIQIATVAAASGVGAGVFYTDATTSPHTTYSYKVRTYRSGTVSDYSNVVTGTTPAGPPGNFVLSNNPPVWDSGIPGAKVTLHWTDSADAGGYTIYRNGRVLPGQGAPYSPTTDAAGLVLGETYTYFVRASNADGTRDSNSVTVPIEFNDLPRIVTHPVSRSIAVGKSVVFSVVAQSDLPATYQWRLNGAAISGATGQAYTIAGVQTGNAGAYSVAVTNAAGTLISNTAWLVVYAPPPTEKPPPPLIVAASQELSEEQQPTCPIPSSDHLKLLMWSGFDKVTMVLTHGWKASFRGWPTEMAGLIQSRYAGVANVVAWDWEDNARKISPASAAFYAPSEGTALANALMDTLGADYRGKIHFLGHSLGTIVNCVAADYLHGSGRPQGDQRAGEQVYSSANTHVTLFDQPELVEAVKGLHLIWDVPFAGFNDAALDDAVRQINTVGSRAIPRNAAWVDNYVSEVAAILHSDACNVLLWRGLIGTEERLFPSHGYAYRWYMQSIQNPLGSAMGHKQSFLWNSVPGPSVGTCYLQSLAPGSPELLVSKINYKFAQAGAAVVYSGSMALDVINALGSVVQDAYMEGIQAAGSMVADYAEIITAPKGTPSYLGTSVSTPAYFVQPDQASAGGLEAKWDLQFTISPSSRMPQPDAPPEPVPSPQSTGGSIYAVVPVHVPTEAVGLSFEFCISGAAVGDVMVMGIGSSNELTIEARFLEDGMWSGTPVIPVSDHRNQDVSLVFALNGSGGEPAGSLSVRNISFYVPPRPRLSLEVVDGQLALRWPISAVDWTLERSFNPADPSAWQEVAEPSIDTRYFHSHSFDRSEVPRAFFRLRK